MTVRIVFALLVMLGPGLVASPRDDLAAAAARVERKDFAGALDALRALYEAGYSTPSDVLADPRFVPLREDAPSRAALRRLLREHPRESSLTMVAPAEPGTPMQVLGRVVRSPDGAPVPGAVLELYHTDNTGRYEPQGDVVGEDANSRLFCFVRTDEKGRFEVRSIRPAPYPDTGPGAAHVHFIVRGDGYRRYADDFRPYDNPSDPHERATALERGERVSTVREEDGRLVVEVTIPLRPVDSGD